MLNVDRLRALLAVAKHGTIARAADFLHTTPSAVSQQLTKLERETGQQLLQPNGRSVRLTPTGRMLVLHADRILAHVADAEADLLRVNSDVLGPLRIGAMSSSIRHLLPKLIADLSSRHPQLVPSIVDGEATDMVPQLACGDLDIVLIESWDNRPVPLPSRLAVDVIARERVDLAVAPTHRLATQTVASLGDLGDEIWAACPQGSESLKSMLQALRGQAIEPEIRYNVGDYTSQLALVAAGLAIAFVPAIAQDPHQDAVAYVSTSPELFRSITAAWRPTAENPAVRACLTALRNVTAEPAGQA